MPKKIVQKDAPVLRKIAMAVDVSEITYPKIQKIIAEMSQALASQDDGVAIAAPQIGYPLRIFVVSHRVPSLVKSDKTKNELSDTTQPTEAFEPTDTIYINPVIKKLSKKKSFVEEGCLSVRYLYGKVNRSVQATVEAYNEKGEKVIRGASGLLAQIFQHETDHLNGVLFIDTAEQVEEIPPKKLKTK